MPGRRSGTPDPKPEKGKLAPYLPLLSNLVETQPRAKIKDLYLILQEQGYLGSYDLVKKKVHSFRKTLGRHAGQAFASPDLPQAQVELGKIVLKSGDQEMRAFLFTMVLGHSGRFYAELIEACEMGRFLQAHQNAFEAFGGVPRTIFYDPQESPLMRRLVGGYPFHLPVVDCGQSQRLQRPAHPGLLAVDEGPVEAPLQDSSASSYFPACDFQSFESANAEMKDWLDRHVRQTGAKERKDRAQKEKLGPCPASASTSAAAANSSA